jgi:hypothetical protein
MQEIWIHYVRWMRDREEDGLSKAFDDTLWGHHHALEALVESFPVDVVTLIQHIDEADLVHHIPQRFHRVLPVLLKHGWSPTSTPRWLRKLLARLVTDRYHEAHWKEFVKTVLVFSRHGVDLEDAEAPLMKEVIAYQLSNPSPPWGDYAVQKVIAKLLQVGVKVTKADVTMAVEGNLFTVVGALAEKISG